MDEVKSPVPRVIHAVATENFAGVERYITYVAPELVRLGVKVLVLGGDGRRMRSALRGTGVEHLLAPNLSSMVGALVATGRANVIHAHMTSAEVAATICKLPLRSALVVTRHFAARRGSRPWSRMAGKFVAHAVDRQIAISNYVATAVEGRTQVLLNGVPCEDVGPHNDATVLVAQRMEEEKDGSVAIEAWALSGLADQGWRLLFAGDGDDRVRLTTQASRLRVSDSVQFLGFVDDISGLMRRASLLLAPAAKEPFGLTVVEAMARALPVIAAAGGGHMETVGAVTPQTTFPPGDAQAAAQLLTRLGNNQGLRQEYGEQLHRFQRQVLSLDRHVEQLMTAYASVSGAFQRPRPVPS